MSEFLFYAMPALTVCLTIALFVRSRAAINRGADVTSIARRFALATSVAGIFVGIPCYFGMLWLPESLGARVDVGHGEVLIATPIVNAMLGFVLAAIGYSLLRWAPVKW